MTIFAGHHPSTGRDITSIHPGVFVGVVFWCVCALLGRHLNIIIIIIVLVVIFGRMMMMVGHIHRRRRGPLSVYAVAGFFLSVFFARLRDAMYRRHRRVP